MSFALRPLAAWVLALAPALSHAGTGMPAALDPAGLRLRLATRGLRLSVNGEALAHAHGHALIADMLRVWAGGDALAGKLRPHRAPAPVLARPHAGAFFRRLLIVAGVVLGAVVLWRTYEILLLVFAAALLATLLRALADFIGRARLPDALAYGLAIAVVLALIAGAAWIFGAQASSQVNALAERLPQAIGSLRGWLENQPWLRPLVDSFDPGGSANGIALRLGGFALTGLDMATGLALILFGGLYFGAQPRLYRRGLILLFPPRLHARAGEALELGAYAMRRWLLGQIVDMAVVGVLTGAGLWAIGAPSPLALGILSGLASFVPYVGPIASGALAVLVAAAQSVQLGMWALVLYVGVQQVEAHLVMPFVQRWTIALPPALGVFAVVAMGYLFGPLGIVLATPLTVVLFVLVKKLYLQDTLGEKVSIEH